MKQPTLRILFARLWLPTYLLLEVVWLLGLSFGRAPEREYLGLAIVAAGILLCLATLATKVTRFASGFRFGKHSKWLGRSVGAAGVLLAASGLDSGLIHMVVLLALMSLIAVISTIDALYQRRAASVVFVAAQLLIALFLVVGIGPAQLQTAAQIVYESALILWLGWLVDRHNSYTLLDRHERLVRTIAGLWALAAGVFALVAAFPHVHFVGRLQLLDRGAAGLLLEQHGIVAGIVALYVGRHLLRGERPALWLALLVFYSLLIKYSLLTPQPLGVVIYGVVVAMLLYTRRGFMRNTQHPTWTSRLSDVLAAVGGLLFAALIVLAVVTLSGHKDNMFRDVGHMYDNSQTLLSQRGPHLSRNFEARLRVLADTLGISVGAIILWSLFRPRSFTHESHAVDRLEFARLLDRYSSNSEDYFKLWPADKQYFSMVGVTGAIAYRVEGGIAYMLADPIAPGKVQQRRLLEGFIAFARTHGLIVSVLAIGGTSPGLYDAVGLQKQQIGSSAVIDVRTFNDTTRHSKWWRWQHNRAVRSGWQYEKLLPPHSPQLVQSLSEVSRQWLEQRGRTEQGFALGYFEEAYLQVCTVHLLRGEDGKVIAFANELPVFGAVRQASVDLIRFVPDADGAMPSLLYEILDGLEGSRYSTFDLGFVPLAKIESELARLIKLLGRNRFSASGLEQFKDKFEPLWHADYLLYDGDLIDLVRIAANFERLLKIEVPDSTD